MRTYGKFTTPSVKSILNATIFLVVFAAAAPAVFPRDGNSTGRLNGVVIDNDRNPIEGVNIILKYTVFNTVKKTTSNKKGQWEFLELSTGQVKVMAEKEGYVPSGLLLKISAVERNPKQYIIMERMSEEGTRGTGLKNNSTTNLRKANAFYKEGKFEAALALYQDILNQKPDLYKIGINIGHCQQELKKYDSAIQSYKTAADKLRDAPSQNADNRELAGIYASIGDAYMRQNKLNEAENYFKKSIQIDPSDHALAYNAAEILFAAGKSDESIKYYLLAIKINPGWPNSYKQIGYAYLNSGNTRAAVENFKKFLELAPDSPEAESIKEVIKSLE
jgi:tetratricopeptide (TPR) repeat protein